LTGLGSHEVWKVFAAAKGYGERGGARVIYVGIFIMMRSACCLRIKRM
jgi:hypothetical protein